MCRIILLILVSILLLILLKKNKETFSNYVLVNEPVNNFYMRFIDFILNERNPKNNYIVQDKYGYTHLLDPRNDPRVVNPQFFFDEGYRYDYPWHNPNQKLIPL